MSESNGVKFQIILLVLSSLIGIWLAGLTMGVVENDQASRERDTDLTSDLNCKYTIIIDKLARIETKVDMVK
jgi:hypothetical protein